MTLVIIKLGDMVYNGKKEEEWYDLLHFLDTVMSPHKENFMDTVKEYIDFSENEELWKEVMRVTGLGMSILEEGFRKGLAEGRKTGREEGIQALILDNLNDKIPKEKSLDRLQRHFQLTKEEAAEYYERFAPNA